MRHHGCELPLGTSLDRNQLCANYFLSDAYASYLNFWPPTLASNIKPSLAIVNPNTPFTYFASFEAPDAAATALTWAASSTLLFLKLSSDFWSSKKITSEYTCPPNCNPIEPCVSLAFPTSLSFSNT